MAFTDAEMAVLSKLAYCKDIPEGASLNEVLTAHSGTLKNGLGDGYKDVIANLLKKTENEAFEIVKSRDDDFGTGFAAIAIRDPSNEVTVAFRGTEGFDITDHNSIRDMGADLELAMVLSTSQHREAEKFMQELEEDDYNGYRFTGHSLGGNLANYAAIYFVPKSKVLDTVTFNAPGYNEAFIEKYNKEIEELSERLKNYQNEYDYVSSIMKVPGEIIVVDSSKKGIHILFDDHMLDTFTVSGDGFKKKKNQVKSVQTMAFDIILDNIRHNSGISRIPYIVGVIEIGINLGRKASSVLQKVGNTIKKVSASVLTMLNGSYIKVDTDSLRSYANRLYYINRRLEALDSRFNDLYWKVGFCDLWDLIQADALTDGSWRLNRCINYLRETATDFDNLETKLVNKL